METTLFLSSSSDAAQAVIRQNVARLTPRELEVCVLHFIEDRSQLLIADWLGVGGRTVRLHVKNALKKIPQLRQLRMKSRVRMTRPRILHLSQLRATERGPFNADEV